MTHIFTFSQDPSVFLKPSYQSQLRILFLKSTLQFTLNTGFLFQFLLTMPPLKVSRFKFSVIFDFSSPLLPIFKHYKILSIFLL